MLALTRLVVSRLQVAEHNLRSTVTKYKCMQQALMIGIGHWMSNESVNDYSSSLAAGQSYKLTSLYTVRQAYQLLYNG